MDNFQNQYIIKLSEILYQIAAGRGFIIEKPFEIDELIEKWDQVAPHYVADAVVEFQDYPTVAIAWAGYVGMGMAKIWDTNWAESHNHSNFYELFKNPRGFDYMDDYILEEFFGLNKNDEVYKKITSLWQSISSSALTVMHKENVTPQSQEAYNLFVSTVKTTYKIGISIALNMMGYKYEKKN